MNITKIYESSVFTSYIKAVIDFLIKHSRSIVYTNFVFLLTLLNLVFGFDDVMLILFLQVWSHADYPLIPVGKMVLDRNPTNYFAEIEQSAFSPAHMIPGVEASPDKMLQVRKASDFKKPLKKITHGKKVLLRFSFILNNFN